MSNLKQYFFISFLFISQSLVAKNPILLIPGIGGSMLQTKNGASVWISIERFLESFADYEDWTRLFSNYTDDGFRKYMLGFYDNAGGLKPAFSEEELITPSSLDNAQCTYNLTPGGLCGVEYLIDFPDTWWDSYVNEGVSWLMQNKAVNYYGELIEFMQNQGCIAGKDLFGFPYDWRLSIRNEATLKRLDETLAKITNNGENKVNIISHSMGCLVTKYYLLAYPENATKYIAKWIAIAGPFQGAGGYAVSQFFSGYAFGNFEICGCTARNLGVQSPSVFEILANDWLENKIGQVTLTTNWDSGFDQISGIEQILNLASHAYYKHTFTYQNQTLNWPLSNEARNFAKQSKILLQSAKMPKNNIKLFAIYGSGVKTPYNISYKVNNQNWQANELLCEEAGCPQDNCINSLINCSPTLQFIDGDGTVPTISAQNPYIDNKDGITFHEVKGITHQNLIKNNSDIFATINKWIND